MYSENDTASTTTFTPSSIFSPTLSADTTVTSAPSEIPTAESSSPPPRNPFPLHIPALAQAQSALCGLFTHPSADAGRSSSPSTPVPSAPVGRTAALPELGSSPPRFFPPDAPGRPTTPTQLSRTESPQPMSREPSSDYFPPPVSESDVGEAQRLAERNAQQYNAASSAYYQAGMRAADGQNGMQQQQNQLGSSSRSVASSSYPTQGSGPIDRIYESSSLGANPPTIRIEPVARLSATYAPSEASSATIVEGEDGGREPPSPHPLIEFHTPLATAGSRERRDLGDNRVSGSFGDAGRYDELRGLTISNHTFPIQPVDSQRSAQFRDQGRDVRRPSFSPERRRDPFLNAFAPTPRSGAEPRLSPSIPSEIPTVVRSDEGS
ncbi:hypothetical protein C8J57DRAFT_45602 [Mycena rebaudengoi]|nr:hypothetical protein C8J57DRAFT_45602 [Mycena rebaudengoi]